MHVEGGVREVDGACADAISRRIEHVPVALLDRDCEVVLGLRFEFAHLVLLVLCEFEQPLGPLQFLEGETFSNSSLHLGLVDLVRGHEHEVVAKRSERLAFGALAFVDRLDEVRDLVDCRLDVDGVVVQQRELWTSVTDLVRDIERTAREGDGVERLACEDLS